jgi:hypothetical protein
MNRELMGLSEWSLPDRHEHGRRIILRLFLKKWDVNTWIVLVRDYWGVLV